MGSLLLGLVFGLVAKTIDQIPASRSFGSLMNVIGNISSGIGVWVAIATIISCWSRAPQAGAAYVFLFFAGLLISYYAYSMRLFGFFPTYYFLRWGAIALVSPLAACIVWFGRGEGWGAAIAAALPVGLLASQGYSFFYTFSAIAGFNILAAMVLLIILPKDRYQRIRTLPIMLVVAFSISRLNVLSYLIGGL